MATRVHFGGKALKGMSGRRGARAPAAARHGAARPGIAGDRLRALERDLRDRVEGDVHFDDGYRAMYATGGSNYKQYPIGVVLPKTIEDVIAAVAACREYGAPLLPRGGGTSLAGQSCNAAVNLDLSKQPTALTEVE